MNTLAANPWYISDGQMLLRLLVAALLGGLVGFERERSNHAAGLRTHIMVSLGSCLLMLLSIYGFAAFMQESNVRADPARLAAAVITGIGFLGAGTILQKGRSIIGLTTAASIWVVSAIGLAVGAGFYLPATAATVMVLLVLWALNKLERKIAPVKKERLIVIETDERHGLLQRLEERLAKRGTKVRKLSVREDGRGAGRGRQVVRLRVVLSGEQTVSELTEELLREEGVRGVSLE